QSGHYDSGVFFADTFSLDGSGSESFLFSQTLAPPSGTALPGLACFTLTDQGADTLTLHESGGTAAPLSFAVHKTGSESFQLVQAGSAAVTADTTAPYTLTVAGSDTYGVAAEGLAPAQPALLGGDGLLLPDAGLLLSRLSLTQSGTETAHLDEAGVV